MSVFSLHEDTHDHADVCTAHGTAVERSHSVRTALTKRACPHGTSSNSSRGATRHTSQQSAGAAVAELNSVKSTPSLSISCAFLPSLSTPAISAPSLLTPRFVLAFLARKQARGRTETLTQCVDGLSSSFFGNLTWDHKIAGLQNEIMLEPCRSCTC